jgi:Holliday junction resolvasome RuvABC endonuclease subunit
MILNNDVTFVIYEQSHHRGGSATEIGVNLTGRVQEICAELKVEYTAIHSATLKKYATGSGRADKAAMVKAALNNSWMVRSDDEADAIFMAKYASETY